MPVLLSAVVCLLVSIPAASSAQAAVRLPDPFRVIGPNSSRRLLTAAWSNLPAAVGRVVGMLIPSAVSPLVSERWESVMAHQEDVDDNARGRRDDEKRSPFRWLFWSGIFAFKKTIFLVIVALAALIRRVVRRRSRVTPPPLPPVQSPS